MSGLLPKDTIDTFRKFNDLAINLYGITCTLYIPTNLTTLEPDDAYTAPDDMTFKRYNQVPVWIEWAVKDVKKLRKLGIFSEDELPIIAWFKNEPAITLQSYITVETRYIPDNFDTDNFEIVEVLMRNTYDSEIYRCFRLAPLRKRET